MSQGPSRLIKFAPLVPLIALAIVGACTSDESTPSPEVGVDAASDASKFDADTKTESDSDSGVATDGGPDGDAAPTVDSAIGEKGACYYKGSSPTSGIVCEAGTICTTGDSIAGGLFCVTDDATPIACGAIGCGTPASDCTCANIPLSQCACAFLTSSASAKRDIAYVDPATEKQLHDDVMTMQLATYRYKPGVTGEDAQHLGFIIEDMPQGSPAVLPSRDKVDLYGYVSMTVAALKVQERELEALKKRIEQLEASGCGGSK